ncbi:MAG: hypothetical protein V8Q84_07320 [Bilophila sp.]
MIEKGLHPASTIRPGIKVQGNSLRRMRLDLSAPDKTRSCSTSAP